MHSWRARAGRVILAGVVVAGSLGALAVPTSTALPSQTSAATLTSSPAGDGYAALSPARLLDTRSTGSTTDGQAVGGGALVGGSPRTVQLTGRGGVPSAGVAAVVLNVTAVSPSTSSFITVFPDGETRPNTSNLNFTAGATTPNLVVVKVGSNGKAAFQLNAGSSHLVVDVAGYFPTGGAISALTPGRLLDTRSTGSTIDGQERAGGALGAGVTRDVQVAGRYGIPASGVDTVILNVTGVKPTATTFATVWPAGATRPNASNLNLRAGEVHSNLVVVKVGGTGKVSVYNNGGSMNVLADVAGWIPTGTTYAPLTPARLLDTRPTGVTVDGVGQRSGAVGANGTVDIQVTGRHGIPSSGVTAVVLNVTGVAPTTKTFVTVYPTGETRPNASNLNLVAGEVRPNLVIAKVGRDGRVRLFNNAGSIHLVADVAGYVSSPQGISGTVRDLGGTQAPLAGVAVHVTSEALGATRTTTTAADGTYAVSGLAMGTDYQVCFAGGNATGGSADQYGYVSSCYGQSGEAGSPVTVARAAETTVDTALAAGGKVMGKVTSASGVALAGVRVSATSASSATTLEAVTTWNGTYAIKGMPAGSDYAVCFFGEQATGGASSAGYLNECHADQPFSGPGTPLTVAVRATTVVDAQLAMGGGIRGLVVEDGGRPLGAVTVRVRSVAQGVDSSLTTAADGTYSLRGLTASADYSVCFDASAAVGGSYASGYLNECFRDMPATGPGTAVTVTPGGAATVNATLGAGAAITGTVTTSAGAGLAGVTVRLYRLDQTPVTSTTTGSDGRYRFAQLVGNASFLVCFDPSEVQTASGTGYVLECYDNGTSPVNALRVTVNNGSTNIVNAALLDAGGVRGVVTDPAGAPLAGVRVSASDSWYGDFAAVTGDDGSYSLRGLPARSSYTVCFDAASASGGSSASGYVSECYDDRIPEQTPTAVVVQANAFTTVNAALAVG